MSGEYICNACKMNELEELYELQASDTGDRKGGRYLCPSCDDEVIIIEQDGEVFTRILATPGGRADLLNE